MAAAKRIFQLAKEFGCEEKKLIEYLTAQGIKVSNRLSAVNEDAYNLLKAKFAAPSESEPVPEPEPVANKPIETPAEGDAMPGKKKKKNKPQQPNEQAALDFQVQPAQLAAQGETLNAATQAVYAEAIRSGNEFIEKYVPYGKRPKKRDMPKFNLTRKMDVWSVLQDIQIDDPDASPVRYWQAVNKLATKGFKLMQGYGMGHRTFLAEMREAIKAVGVSFEPQEIFTDEENQLFEEQRKLLFQSFGHGMGAVNDNLFALKSYAEHKKRSFESMNFVEYLTNPEYELETKAPMPFAVLADSVAHSLRGVPRRVDLFQDNRERISGIIKKFFEWIDGYKNLKEQGADEAKLEKYMHLEKKFVTLIEFMSFDNLLGLKKKKLIPFDIVLDLLENYRDDLDNPDAKRNFQYKVRGITNVIQKPKEFVFLWNFAELEPGVDYRSPEEIAAEAAAAEAAAAETSDAETTDAETTDAETAAAETADAETSDDAEA